jgi:hypothetical protein
VIVYLRISAKSSDTNEHEPRLVVSYPPIIWFSALYTLLPHGKHKF